MQSLRGDKLCSGLASIFSENYKRSVIDKFTVVFRCNEVKDDTHDTMRVDDDKALAKQEEGSGDIQKNNILKPRINYCGICAWQ